MKIMFREVDKTNRKEVKRLKTAPQQKWFIYSNAACLRQSWRQKRCTMRAIYDENTLAGFTFYGRKNKEKSDRIWLYSFMFGAQYQGRGYGKTAIPLVLRDIFTEYACDAIYLSVHPGNAAAITIYKKNGFVFTGELNKYRERIMVLRAAE